ncbi:OmpH family outer membrane protein [Myxococcota bacterium]|nr:OmpH family outer membrane protein [Myxococcota bacterium]MCZ7618592.1 OmpH family outer membrane protein [Myxococcota bacterium]
MRVAIRSLLLAVGMLAWAGAAHAEDSIRIAVVDIDQAVNATDQGKQARDELVKKRKAAEAQLKPMMEKGKAMAEELQSKRFVLSEEALYQKQLDLAELQNDARARMAELEGQYKVDSERLVGPLRQKLIEIINEIGKSEGFTLILERNTPGVLYSREALDITDMVIKRFNKKR